MPISAEYRPAITETTPLRVELDGWAAGGGDTNGVLDAHGVRWRIRRFDGWHDGPAPRTSLTDRAGEHGSFDGPAFLQSRLLTLEGVAIAPTYAAALRARDIVASVCGDPSLGLSALVVTKPGRPTMRMLVRRSDWTKTGAESPLILRWSMILVAPDPRRYADTLSSQSIGLPVSGTGGLVFPLVFPLTFGTGLSGGNMALTSGGTIATWPTWSVLGPVTGPVITNVDTGEKLEFDTTFTVPAGQTMVIDTDAKTVLLQGINRRDRLFVAQWFDLPPGTTNIRFGSASGSDPAALLTAQWRDAWT